MATISISANTTTPFDMNDDGDTYIVESGVTVSVSNDNAFFGNDSFTGNTIRILGTVETVTANPTIFMQGNKTHIDIRNTGVVSSQHTAVWLQGNSSDVINAGTIDAAIFGIRTEGTGTKITNNDTISAVETGIRIEANGGEITNNGTIDAKVGINGRAAAGDTLLLVNEGTITGSQSSFTGWNEDDKITNRGSMVGDINLLAGNDSIDTRGGTVTGKIFGGFGNDTYTVSSASVKPVEQANQGSDTIISTVSYVLQANIETLRLSGSAAINGTGTNSDDFLLGNSGANKLSGKNGDDSLAGGKGNDTLTGGADVDTFIFANLMGKDKITDFVAAGGNHDIIDLSDVTAIQNFADLKANHLERSGDDVVIRINSSHNITIEDVTVASLKAQDFLF